MSKIKNIEKKHTLWYNRKRLLFIGGIYMKNKLFKKFLVLIMILQI